MKGRAKLISHYVLKEVIGYFALSCLVFCFLFLMGKLFEITRLIIVHRVSISIVFKLLIYTQPYFLSYIIPISALLSTLLTFYRLNHDREYLAIKTAGLGPGIFIKPLLILASGLSFLTLIITSWGIPLGSGAARDLVFKVTRQKAEVAFKPGVFNSSLPGLIIYVGQIQDNHLKNVFIYDHRHSRSSGYWHQGQTIIARSGQLWQSDHQIVISLKDGCILKEKFNKKPAETTFLRYQQYNLTVNLPNNFQKRQKNPKEFPPWRLWQLIKQLKHQGKDPTAYILAFHRKLVLPISAFIFVFLGAALGLKNPGKRIGAIEMGLICFIGYQVLFSAASSLGETHTLPPHLSLWLPNVLMAIVCIYLWYGVIHD